MPGGGKLTIESSKVQLSDLDRPNMACVVFRDTGKGIPAKIVKHIFDFYYSTKPSGTGLGLPVAQQIIEEHGGSIKVESAVGSGTAVSVYVPLIQ